MTAGVFLFAPNVHVGGGLILLREALAQWPDGWAGEAWLDARAKDALALPAGLRVHWVAASLPGRAAAQWRLARRQQGAAWPLLCFHGLPPFWPALVPVAVYLQNRNLIEPVDWSRYPARVALRMRVERWLARALRHRVDHYWVQTPTMAQSLQRWWADLGETQVAPVSCLPFVAPLPAARAEAEPGRRWDFVYVADGEGHKNHAALLEAWHLLAAQGLRPSLALTLAQRDGPALALLDAARAAGLLHVQTVGALSHAGVLDLYQRASALIFPSRSESFGLPLLEARQAGLPILAGELDFVRDVCEPVQTFDPQSPRSIARAVRRFLGAPEPVLSPQPAASLWQALQDLRSA